MSLVHFSARMKLKSAMNIEYIDQKRKIVKNTFLKFSSFILAVELQLIILAVLSK